MNALFQPMNQQQRQNWQAKYLRFLQERDGTPNLLARSFDVREKFFREIDQQPIRWGGPPLVNKNIFQRNLRAQDPEPNLDEATLWALTVAKVNRSERFGVDYSLDRRKPAPGDLTDPYLYAGIEEVYHTRILRDVVALLGLDMEMGTPPFFTRTLIKAMSRFPKSMANILIFNGEIAGVVIFYKLFKLGQKLLPSQPAVLARANELFTQILVDEIGHVYFLRSNLNAQSLMLAKGLLPTMISVMLDDLPEATMLFGKETLVKDITSTSLEEIAQEFAPTLRQ